MDSGGTVFSVGTSVAVVAGMGVPVGSAGTSVSVGASVAVATGMSVAVDTDVTTASEGVWVSAAWACAGDQPPVPKQRDKVNPANKIP